MPYRDTATTALAATASFLVDAEVEAGDRVTWPCTAGGERSLLAALTAACD